MVVHIVEDDEAVADALAIALEDFDHHSVTYKDAESFLASAAPSSDDWVIVDIGLPDRCGTEVVRELMDLPAPPGILAISGKSKVNLLQQIRELPDLTVLRKPLSIDMVTAAMAPKAMV
ncbi:response regulator [Stappia sp. BW2]|uniref:response regulator n=1 Tax=Stappia sp. BW2 TaxID=2592622 RepID=UPI0011DE9C85|nr:response regulator [Stappia sp. BW2]TYC67449.1 response regulator [Stappia sp. BW2]